MCVEHRRATGDDHAGREDGVALIAALFAVVILAGLAVVFVATAVFESRSTAGSRDFESAVHVAEASVHALVPRLNEDPDGHVTEDALGQVHTYDLDPDATDEEQRAWFLEIAEDQTRTPSSMLVPMAGGEALAIRPRDAAGPMDLIFAVGWVPSREAPVRRRVLKVRFDSLRYSPDFGLFTGGALTFGGDARVTGDFGNVHSNDAAASSGSSFHVEGDFTSSGPSAVNCAQVDGDCVGGVAPRPVPHISARQMYGLADQASGGWYDLCPPGGTTPATVRAWSSGGPCTGTLLWTEGDSNNFRGWRYQTGGQRGARWRSHNMHRGVYYVHQSNADLGPMEPRSATVIVEEKLGDGGRASGHIELSGEPKMSTALSGLTLIADRDIDLDGDGQFEGLVAANEQIRVTGDVSVTGAVIAQDEKDTPGSLISESSVSGNMHIHYDAELEVPLTGVIRITAWNEL